MNDISSRSEGIVDNLGEYNYHVLGCGAIGSSVSIQLVRMGAIRLYLYDMDKVAIENIGVSRYYMTDIGKAKVEALSHHLLSINQDIELEKRRGRFKRFKESLGSQDIVILGFDNMASRLMAAKEALGRDNSPFALIDGRMGAEHYQQYTLIAPTIEKYKKTWYSDAEGSPEPCNAKATSYCSDMSGAFITNAIRKIVRNIPVPTEFFFNFPGLVLASNVE